MEKKSYIEIAVQLNEQGMPETIDWKAPDNPHHNDWQASKAMLLSLFDKETRDTMKIDLWTTDMQVVEMDRFMFQTLRSLADTYFKATQNHELANQMQQFVQYFGEKTEILPPTKS